jgi:rhodanese-related sulfurtransferase
MAISEIDVDALAALIERGDVRLVDVREPDEFETAHVPGAVPVPLATVPDRVDAFRGDGPTYVICQGGGRSMRACEFVADHGVEAVNVIGGTGAWMASGRATVSGSQ